MQSKRKPVKRTDRESSTQRIAQSNNALLRSVEATQRARRERAAETATETANVERAIAAKQQRARDRGNAIAAIVDVQNVQSAKNVDAVLKRAGNALLNATHATRERKPDDAIRETFNALRFLTAASAMRDADFAATSALSRALHRELSKRDGDATASDDDVTKQQIH